MKPIDTTLAFVARINAHDVSGLMALMSSGHRLVDSLGAAVIGREALRVGWSSYFRMVPDYHIEVSRTFADGEEVVLLGTASGTYTRDGTLDPRGTWQMPAAWHAVVGEDLVEKWQVYADNEPIRRCMAQASR